MMPPQQCLRTRRPAVGCRNPNTDQWVPNWVPRVPHNNPEGSNDQNPNNPTALFSVVRFRKYKTKNIQGFQLQIQSFFQVSLGCTILRTADIDQPMGKGMFRYYYNLLILPFQNCDFKMTVFLVHLSTPRYNTGNIHT